MTDISPEQQPQGDPTPEGVEPDETTEDETADEGDPRLAKARNEAKGLRTRLREAEAERDGLRSSLTVYNQIEAATIAEDYLTVGDDLFRGGVELADLLGDDGTVDDDLVHAAARRVAKEHPHWSAIQPVSGLTPGMSSSSGSGTSWQKVLQGKP